MDANVRSGVDPVRGRGRIYVFGAVYMQGNNGNLTYSNEKPPRPRPTSNGVDRAALFDLRLR